MTPIANDKSFTRKGMSLIWDPELLAEITDYQSAVTIRQFCQMKGQWPESLASRDGHALVVVGLEACMDVLKPSDAEKWLEQDIKPLVLDFQDEYQGQCALIFWIPSGMKKIKHVSATDNYVWQYAAPNSGSKIEIGRILWAGAQREVRPIVTGMADVADDMTNWKGLHHPRIS